MTSHHPQTLLAAIAIVVMVAVTACGDTAQPQAPDPPPTATAAVPTPIPQSEASAGPEDGPESTPVDNHSPHQEFDQEAITAAAEAAARFIDGWTTLDPVKRSRLLEPVASRELFEMFTDPRFQPINATPSGPVHIHVDGFHAVARQRLDHSTTQVVLVIDPTSEPGWRVIDIERS